MLSGAKNYRNIPMALHCALSVSFFFLNLCLYVPEGNLRATLKTSELKIRGMVGGFLGPLLDPPLL